MHALIEYIRSICSDGKRANQTPESFGVCVGTRDMGCIGVGCNGEGGRAFMGSPRSCTAYSKEIFLFSLQILEVIRCCL